MPLGLLGKKLGHTRVYNAAGTLIPVTVVLAGPNRVLQVKTQAGKDDIILSSSVLTIRKNNASPRR